MNSDKVEQDLGFLKGALRAAAAALASLEANLSGSAPDVSSHPETVGTLSLLAPANAERSNDRPKVNMLRYAEMVSSGEPHAVAVDRECASRGIVVDGSWSTKDEHRCACPDTLLSIVKKGGGAGLGAVLDLAIELFPTDSRRFARDTLTTLYEFLSKYGTRHNRAYLRRAVSGVTIKTLQQVARRSGERNGRFVTELVNRSGQATA